jgi:hypothetical protein
MGRRGCNVRFSLELSPPLRWKRGNIIRCAFQSARYMTLETITPLSDDPLVSLPATAS